MRQWQPLDHEQQDYSQVRQTYGAYMIVSIEYSIETIASLNFTGITQEGPGDDDARIMGKNSPKPKLDS